MEKSELRFPSPEDPSRGPVWENYVTAQASQASLGLIPRSALALGVEVSGATVTLRVQLSELTDQDARDIDDIVSDLGGLLGPRVTVSSAPEVRAERQISPHDGVRWTFLARLD